MWDVRGIDIFLTWRTSEIAVHCQIAATNPTPYPVLTAREFTKSLLVLLLGSAWFGADLLVSRLLLSGALTGFGLVGLGAAIAGIAGVVGAWRERRFAVQVLRERDRQARLIERIDRIERGS